jgi:hypothetical protein
LANQLTAVTRPADDLLDRGARRDETADIGGDLLTSEEAVVLASLRSGQQDRIHAPCADRVADRPH